MDWIKVKGEHVSPEYTDAQVGALVRFQLLVARLKRMPTDKEIYRETSRKNWTSLVVSMKLFEVDPKLICEKVLEDVKLIENKREVSRRSSAKLRLNRKKSDGHVTHDVTKGCDVSRDETDKRREDKIREDKEKIYKKESLNNYNPETSINRLDIKKALRDCMDSFYPKIKHSNVEDCYSLLWERYEVTCDTATQLREAVEAYSDFLKHDNREEKFYPKFINFLKDEYQNWIGVKKGDIDLISITETPCERAMREYNGPLKG